jgi:hypothetical protein
MSQTAPQKRHGLYSLAILFLVLGCAGVIAGYRSFAIRSLGLVALMVSAYFVRISKVHASPAPAIRSDLEADSKGEKGPGRLAWAVGIALVPAAGMSYLYLYNDAIHGYHAALPVYVFAGVGLTCAIVWAYLVAKMVS